MEVICLEDEAFYILIDKVVDRIKEKLSITQDQWVTPEEAMRKLGITSKSTLQKYRDENRIRFSQSDKKVIMYDLQSINAYLDKNANK